MQNYKDKVAQKNFELSQYLPIGAIVGEVVSGFIALLIVFPLLIKLSSLSLDKNIAISFSVGLFGTLTRVTHKLTYNKEKSLMFNNPFSLVCYATAAGADLVNDGVEKLRSWKQNRENSKKYDTVHK